MSDDKERDPLARADELFAFLQGTAPNGYKIPPAEMPKLSAEQAWTVIWYLGNQYWQVPDFVELCDVCGELYNKQSEGTTLDYGDAPYHYCESCESSWECETKKAQEPNHD